MKMYMTAAAAAMLVTTGASAGSHNPAVKDPTAVTTQLAAKGRNSFTESQAQGRIAKAGYANVSKLMKNEKRRVAGHRHEGWCQGQRRA